MYVNVRQKTHHYDINVVTHKSFTCKTFFLNRGFSYEKLRITANNCDKLRKAKTSCKFPIRTLSTLKVVSRTVPKQIALYVGGFYIYSKEGEEFTLVIIRMQEIAMQLCSEVGML